jgi:hypothetical protein
MEKRKQNWDEVFMDEVKGGESKRGERGERREEKIKCHEMFGDRKE